MRATLSLLFLALAMLAGPSALAVQSTTASQTINGRAVATELRDLLNKYYVLEEARPKFDRILNSGSQAGRYDVSDREVLLQRLAEDLRSVTADKHLSIAYDPETSAQLRAPQAANAGDTGPSAEEIAAAVRINHGMSQMRVLPGNVRYLETAGFKWWVGKPSQIAFEDAIKFLAGGDAVIIDLRGNGGGSVEAVRTLISPFLPPNTKLMTFQLTTDGPSTSVTAARKVGPNLAGKPLYVLTGPGAASAAEEFAGHVQGFKLGELIGKTTAGAGFRNAYFALPDGFFVSISIGQAILASTGKGWEAVGIAPTVETPVDAALDVAHSRALKFLAATAAPNERRAMEVQAAMLAARANR